MSKIGKCLEMYLLLQAKAPKRARIKELAAHFECSEKSIRLYRDALDEAGLHVHSEHGRYGGYYVTPEGRQLIWKRQ